MTHNTVLISMNKSTLILRYCLSSKLFGCAFVKYFKAEKSYCKCVIYVSVLPKFEVSIELAPFVLSSDETVEGKIKAT